MAIRMSWIKTGLNRQASLIQQIAGLQSYLGQHRLRHIATASVEILGDVFHNVRQLQPFPESHADWAICLTSHDAIAGRWAHTKSVQNSPTQPAT